MPDPIPFPLLVTDADGLVTHVNPSARALLGEAAAGRNCRALVDALGERGRSVCAPCLGAGPTAGEQRFHGAVQVRGERVELVCSSVGTTRVIALREAEGIEGSGILTPRERAVLVLVARGLTNARVAERLSVSPATVRSHMEHLMRKLDVRSRSQAVARALSLGEIA
ncbi:MAG: helix-turn-helix transcriptional regulator [Pseudomonadota bacterium]|nr:helix-turn-helix transcriptional regulator [Pseudomonadota bacterium]